MVKVVSELLILGIVGSPVPSLPDFREAELIFRHFRVNSCSGVAVPSPGTLRVVRILAIARRR